MNKLSADTPHFASDRQIALMQLFSAVLTVYMGMFQLLMLPRVMHS